ncbi:MULTISPECIES: hypothetical protein [unclassified Streptomyces]|uniref:hypothetical protein n=1 Tax=unclassified Streptomyces TaxID=2593676 RepID=UPI002365CD4F|nr:MULTISPECIES: hypothetical protein [unclassified Streptomyces]MDF3141958.1 hypothetical protein [Streptomyces sp. T21Q-yed]WDF40335.1 hypothetical protein PBV52_27915 [Streptomyces sp. T12]
MADGDKETGKDPKGPKELHNERQMWWWLGYFLFGIHIVAFVMIYAVTHAPK